MKKLPRTKLSLRTETVQALDHATLEGVVGGRKLTYGCVVEVEPVPAPPGVTGGTIPVY